MITPLPPRCKTLTNRPALNVDRRSRRKEPFGSPGPTKAIAALPARLVVASITRDANQLCASWPSEHACFELVVHANSTDLHVKLCTWLSSGSALEERFIIHTLAEFEQWIAKAPTKFDHPVAHEEIKRFAHGILAR